jgi:hypothetical protein
MTKGKGNSLIQSTKTRTKKEGRRADFLSLVIGKAFHCEDLINEARVSMKEK